MDKAIEIAKDGEDKSELAGILDIAANIYYLRGDYYNAQVHNNEAKVIAKEINDPEILKSAYNTSSSIHTALYEYEDALSDYKLFLSVRDSLLIQRSLQQQQFMKQQFNAERFEKDIAAEEIEELAQRQLILDTIRNRQQIALQRKTIDLQQATIENSSLEKIRLEQEAMLAEERIAAGIRDREILQLKLTEQVQQDSIRQIEELQRRTELEMQTVEKENALQQEQISRQRARMWFLLGIVFLALLLLFLVWRGLRYAKQTNIKLTDQRNKIQQQKEAIESQYEIIERERAKSDKLLLNILPEETAEELKEKGSATPRQYEMVSVLFTDFVGFTKISMKLTPEEIIKELDFCFLEFDRISDRHNMEKIKTIGDAYMSAGGIPVANISNPVDAVEAALEIKEFMDKMKDEKEARGESYWELRIGIHTGTIVAGVVGKNKFAYDIWGDAVNTASRMESSGEAGKVNISGETYELVKDKFNCTYRGKVTAKNKGEIDMYFVDSKIDGK